MYVEVSSKIKAPLKGFDCDTFGYIADDGTRLISAVPVVKCVGELKFDDARKFCTGDKVRQEFNRLEIGGIEFDLLSLEDPEKMERVMRVLLGVEQEKLLQRAMSAMLHVRDLLDEAANDEEE